MADTDADTLYLAYKTYIAGIDDIRTSQFRRHPAYIDMLEHVTPRLGAAYAALISAEFPESLGQVEEYVALNDRVGDPYKARVALSQRVVECAPTSMRYAYQALTILEKFKASRASKIVEVGCGYGGLFLAIDFFAKRQCVPITKYHLVDLPEAGRLISKHLACHELTIPHAIHDATAYGSTVDDTGLFLISNYCFTEIAETHRGKYVEHLFGKVAHGFITWQTNSVPLDKTAMYLPNHVCSIQEEKPQTSGRNKNYFVTWGISGLGEALRLKAQASRPGF